MPALTQRWLKTEYNFAEDSIEDYHQTQYVEENTWTVPIGSNVDDFVIHAAERW